MAEKEEMKAQEQDYKAKSEVWFEVVERYEKAVPCFLLATTYFRNKVFFVCNMDLLNVFIDCYVALYPESGKNRAWVHDELESLYGFNLLVDPEAPEEGYFIDDLGARLGETDANHWKVLRQRWKEEEDGRRRNLRRRGKKFFEGISERIEGLERETGSRDLTPYILLLNRADYDLLVVGDAVVKKKRHVIRPHEVKEGLGIEVIVHSACGKGGMIIERAIAGAPKPR